ncbi:Rieske (2Fe-2S) protein [Nocardioides sp. YIM 152588]|uniref:Rieske (2Fe-2S) protein n=1 Tax=Nocardioides sp. YIM 152588 TaxID=3158259 RepID=UPI0032E49BA5
MTTPLREARATRRMVFSGLGALGVAAALAGCAGDSGSAPTVTAGDELATASEVPVGGGIVLTDAKIVLTQPVAGEFKAFTAVCTHQGLTVTSVDAGTIRCSHHGSAYSADSGEVESGPAPSPLAEVAITVDGDRILAA